MRDVYVCRVTTTTETVTLPDRCPSCGVMFTLDEDADTGRIVATELAEVSWRLGDDAPETEAGDTFGDAPICYQCEACAAVLV